MRRRAVLAAAVLFEGGVLVLALVQGWLFGLPPFARLTWTWGDALVGVAGTLPMFAAMWWTTVSSWPPVVRIREEIEGVAREIFVHLAWGDLVLISLLAGVAEEALFRGVLQTAFGTWISPGAGLAVASTLFGLVHFVTPLYAVLAGIIGLWLGVLFHLTGNLLGPVVAHALYDLIALTLVVRGVRDAPEEDPPAA